jgi:hypothetical protein
MYQIFRCDQKANEDRGDRGTDTTGRTMRSKQIVFIVCPAVQGLHTNQISTSISPAPSCTTPLWPHEGAFIVNLRISTSGDSGDSDATRVYALEIRARGSQTSCSPMKPVLILTPAQSSRICRRGCRHPMYRVSQTPIYFHFHLDLFVTPGTL